MSWDVLFFASPSEPPALSDLPEGWPEASLGTREEVRQRISGIFPGTDWTDPGWGLLQDRDLSLEFNIGDDDPCRSFAVHVRGRGDAAAAVDPLTRVPGWYGLDMTQSQWLHRAADPSAGWLRFSAYRDQLFGRPPSFWRRLLARLGR